MASIRKRNDSYFIMVSCGASSFAVLAEGDYLTKSPSCSRRDSSFPQKAGLFGDPEYVRQTGTQNHDLHPGRGYDRKAN